MSSRPDTPGGSGPSPDVAARPGAADAAAPAGGGPSGEPPAEMHAGLGAQVISYAVILLIATGLFVKAGSLPASRWEPLGAGAFPRLIMGALMLVCTIALVGSGRRWLKERAERAAGPGWAATLHRYRLVGVVLAGFVVYVAVLPWLGFSIASFLFLLAIQLVLGPKTLRALAVMVAIAVVFSFGLNLLFAEAFTVFLPRGRLIG